MLSDTLTEGLERYRIGPKIRALRQQKKLGLVQLGNHTGLSPGMLSKIERGQIFPTLPTLLRIALVFGVGLEHFFVEDGDEPAIAVVRRSERVKLPDRPGANPPTYFFESLDFPMSDRRMEAFYAEFPMTSPPSTRHAHAGAEFIYVVSGKLGLTVEEHETVLDAGDSVYFDSEAPHSYRREGDGPCSIVVVVTAA